MADRVSRRGERKTVQFRGMIVWIIVFHFLQHLKAHNLFFLSILFRNFDDRLSSNFHRFVILVTIVSTVFKCLACQTFLRPGLGPYLCSSETSELEFSSLCHDISGEIYVLQCKVIGMKSRQEICVSNDFFLNRTREST